MADCNFDFTTVIENRQKSQTGSCNELHWGSNGGGLSLLFSQVNFVIQHVTFRREEYGYPEKSIFFTFNHGLNITYRDSFV